MPIKNLTVTAEADRIEPTAGLPLLGVLHKGEQRTEEMIAKKRPGSDLDYFRVEMTPRFEHLRAVFEKCYGKQPTEFDPILIFGSTPDEAFPTWREHRTMNGARIARRCDGETQVMYVDKQGKTCRVDHGAPPLTCIGGRAEGGCAECKFAGRMKVFLIRLFERTHVFGYFLLTTGSQQDIANVSGALVRLEGLMLDQIVFRLGRQSSPVGWRQYEDRQTRELKQAQVFKSLLYLEVSDLSAEKVAHLLEQKTDVPLLVERIQQAPALPDGNHEEDIQDGEYSETPDSPARTPDEWCKVVEVLIDKKNVVSYVLRCQKRNYVLSAERGDPLFKALGFKPTAWKTTAQSITMDPLLQVFASSDSVTGLEIEDVPF